MPIQPIDNILIAQRSDETGRSTVIRNERAHMEQTGLMQQKQIKDEHNLESTTALNETDGGKEHYDAREKSRNEYEADQRKKKKKEEEEKKLRIEAGIGGSKFDVTI